MLGRHPQIHNTGADRGFLPARRECYVEVHAHEPGSPPWLRIRLSATPSQSVRSARGATSARDRVALRVNHEELACAAVGELLRTAFGIVGIVAFFCPKVEVQGVEVPGSLRLVKPQS